MALVAACASRTSPPTLCLRHFALSAAKGAIPRENSPLDEDLSADLGISAGEFNSTEEIYNFLGKLIFLLAANRISARRAAVLAYVTNQLLRTNSVLEKEFEADQKEAGQQIVIDVTRPVRPPVGQPS
jgi:hypothetical protein